MPPKKEEPKPKDLFVEVVWILVTIFFFYMLYTRLTAYLAYYGHGTVGGIWGSVRLWFGHHIWPVIKIIGAVLTAASMVGIWHSARKLNEVVEEERKIYGPFPDEKKAEEKGEAPMRNERWERVITHINSNAPSDWRLAVIEADIMLDELLRKLGYHGDSIGDMLKAVEKSDMLTLDAAWEAHKVRNRIAHSGTDYDLTERDAKRVVALYEAVFKEFQII